MNMKEFRDVKLDTLANGDVVKAFDKALDQVLKNILDQSTAPDDMRSIVLDIKFKPDRDRSAVACAVLPKVKLASPMPVGAILYVTKKGKPKLVERQMEMDFEDEKITMVRK